MSRIIHNSMILLATIAMMNLFFSCSNPMIDDSSEEEESTTEEEAFEPIAAGTYYTATTTVEVFPDSGIYAEVWYTMNIDVANGTVTITYTFYDGSVVDTGESKSTVSFTTISDGVYRVELKSTAGDNAETIEPVTIDTTVAGTVTVTGTLTWLTENWVSPVDFNTQVSPY